MELMTCKAYAERVKCPVSTIRKLCSTNILPSCKIGVAWHVDVLGADNYFKEKIAARNDVRKTIVSAPVTPKRPARNLSYLEKLKAL